MTWLINLREKSSRTKCITFCPRDDNRAFSEIICRTQENNYFIKGEFLGVKLYKNRRFVSLLCKGEAS